MSATLEISKPHLRIRIAHSNTMKEGWRLSETTVEWVGPITEASHGPLSHALQEAFLLGTEEAIRRQADEKRLAE